MVKISIVTPTYNRLKSGYLELCINSIINQKLGDYILWEHIIVDDGSTDGTESYIKSLENKFKHIKYLKQNNSGPAKAVKKGIEEATGDYIIILDDDDLLTEDSLQLRSNFINKNPDIDWFFGLALWIDDYGLPTNNLYQSKYYKDNFYERMLITNHVNSGTPTIRANAFKDIQWPDWLNRSQDYFLWLELLRPARGLSCGFINEYLVQYRIHQQSYTAIIENEEQKNKKKLLNLKIKSLHNSSLAFLAEEALNWREEAHLNNRYKQEEIDNLNKTIANLYKRIEDYEKSRYISKAIKVRNVGAAQKKNLLSAGSKLKRKFNKQTLDNLVKVTVDSIKWDDRIPLVTIVSPFYNRSDTMPETIRSVLCQTFQDFEYIIVDDGSTEKESIEYINYIHHPKIRVIKQKNQGVAVARNTGIENAKGKYIVCLDSDDILDSTFIEKAVLKMELNPSVDFVTYDMQMFGHIKDTFIYPELNPLNMLKDNYVITAAVFKKEAWVKSGGYKPDIGYEDWEFWVNIVENGFFGTHLPEKLFRYRTAKKSRYIDDLINHHFNETNIKILHPKFIKNVKALQAAKPNYVLPPSINPLINIKPGNKKSDKQKAKPNILILIPWMPVGGAETLTLTFCNAIKNDFNIHFITGLKGDNEWEDKFREITPNILHLSNITENTEFHKYLVDYYIKTRNIDILHVLHSGFVFGYLEEIKELNKHIKVIVTLFNDRVPDYVNGLVNNQNIIDAFSTDNKATYKSISNKTNKINKSYLIPNAVDTDFKFNPNIVDGSLVEQNLRIKKDERIILFVGRLSEEKNPDKFIDAAKIFLNKYPNANARFLVIGDGPMLRGLEEKANKINDKRIQLLGYQENVSEFLKIADIFVLPSSIEGFPLSLLEAMAMATVPIASKVGAIPDVIKDGLNGYLVHPGDATEIANSIINLYNNPDTLEDNKTNAHKAVIKDYSIKRLAKDYINMYRSVLK